MRQGLRGLRRIYSHSYVRVRLMWRARRELLQRGLLRAPPSAERRDTRRDTRRLGTRDSCALSIWSGQRQRDGSGGGDGDGGSLNACHAYIESGARCAEPPAWELSGSRSSSALRAFWLSYKYSTEYSILYSVHVLSARADCDSDTRMFCVGRREKKMS